MRILLLSILSVLGALILSIHVVCIVKSKNLSLLVNPIWFADSDNFDGMSPRVTQVYIWGLSAFLLIFVTILSLPN